MKHVLLTALGMGVIASAAQAQCDVLDQDFQSIPNVPIPVATLGGWSSTGLPAPSVEAVTPTHPLGLLAGPTSINQLLRLNGFGGPKTATMSFSVGMNSLVIPDEFTFSFEAATQLDSSVIMDCASMDHLEIEFAGVGGSNPMILINQNGITCAQTPFTPFTRQSVQVDVDRFGLFEVTINGSVICTDTWDSPFGPTCNRPEQLRFTCVEAGEELMDSLYVDNLCITSGGSMGVSYCGTTAASNNTTGTFAKLEAIGLTNASVNVLRLRAYDLPPNQFGQFVTSLTPSNPLSGLANSAFDGRLCIGGLVGRFMGPGQIMNSGPAGVIATRIDLSTVPQGAGVVTVMENETWYYQAFYRDSGTLPNGSPSVGSNLSEAVSVTFD